MSTMKETERVQAGPGRGHGPFGGGMVGQKSENFGPSAKRLVSRLRPQRGKVLTVVGLGTHDDLLASCETYQEIVESQLQTEAA